ncbi:MAG: nucleotidyltransferase domain-containing protein [Muribaculaceae bacterium]|nr:nucleotidyltransferase domain-containing protein [Muribaculaceae bacterium]
MSEKERKILIIQNYFKDKPVDRVWLFGSYARGDFSNSSDIDLLVDFNQTISLLTQAKYIIDLEEMLEIPVDIVPEDCLLPEIKPFVDQDKFLIYER